MRGLSLLTQFLSPQVQLTSPTSTQSDSCIGVQQVFWTTKWDLLGPFQIGTREAEWGADPLAIPKYGGFLNLNPANLNTSFFRSSLSRNGTVSWSSVKLATIPTPTNSTIGTLAIEFANNQTDWLFLRDIYGWSGTQFQAWCRGYLWIAPCEGDRNSYIPIAIQIDPILEFHVDGKHYFGGDMYSYRRAPLILYLKPGKHQIDLRITHDVRAFGGRVPPKLSIRLEAKITKQGVVMVPDRAVISDVVDGVLAGEWGSVPVRNEGKEWAEITAIESADPTASISMLQEGQILCLAPGQSRPLKFRVSEFRNGTLLSLKVFFRTQSNTSSAVIGIPLNHKLSIYVPHVFTFLHPSGIVSYAALRPPSEKASCSPVQSNKIPIILTMHGAGVDVHSEIAQSAYDALPDLCSWVIFAQGVTLWSGDDWHNWGFADVEAAIAAIPNWMNQTQWNRQGVDLDKWIVTGHSNGGQGTWHALTHKNDKILAATPLSGYLSISAYVSYHMWHEADPKMSAIIMASLNTYRYELLVKNFAGTPIYQLHGELDDNVPAFHSRRMALLAVESGHQTIYYEVPGQGHWWEGVMTAASLPSFLKSHLQNYSELSKLPEKFSIIVANPGDTGPRGGISVDQLQSYAQLGRVEIERLGTTWLCTTSNIRRFHLDIARPGTPLPQTIIVDGQQFRVADLTEGLFLESDGKWAIPISDAWRRHERHSSQLGALDSFLRSPGPFKIVLPAKDLRAEYHESVALDISRALYQYFAADSEIGDQAVDDNEHGNLVLFELPVETTKEEFSFRKDFPILKREDKLLLKMIDGKIKTFTLEPGLGIIFIRPLPKGKLALVVWGADEEGFRMAARLLPLRTGVGQPNFVVVGPECMWKGIYGVKAMGIYDSEWRIENIAF